MRRGEIWTLADGRNVLIVSLDGLEDAFGAVLAIVLHPSGRYPDTAMSVVIDDPMPCTAVAVNMHQLRTTRFKGATCVGTVPTETMAHVDQALRSVLDLQGPGARGARQRCAAPDTLLYPGLASAGVCLARSSPWLMGPGPARTW
ncbi:hypothetical protein [Streptomyces sp. NPDC055099]